MVDDGEIFVRSVRGERGRWFQAALDRPADVALIAKGHRIPVRAALAADEASISRCSAALESKYGRDPALPSMIKPSVLSTTLRLEPI